MWRVGGYSRMTRVCVAAAAILASACQSIGSGLGKGAVSGATSPESLKSLGRLADQVGDSLLDGAVGKLATPEESERIARVVHDAVAELSRTLDDRLRSELGPTIRTELQATVQTVLDKLLAAGNRTRLADTLRALVGTAVDEAMRRAEERARALVGDLGPGVTALLDDRIGPGVEEMLEHRVGPAVHQILSTDVMPDVEDLLDHLIARFKTETQPAVNVALVVLAVVFAVGLTFAVIRLIRTWHAEDALRMVVLELARRRDDPSIRATAAALKSMGSAETGGRYLAEFIRRDDAARNVLSRPAALEPLMAHGR